MQIVYVMASVPQSTEEDVKSMARKYSNILYLPVHYDESDVMEVAKWKKEWEGKIYDIVKDLPSVHSE